MLVVSSNLPKAVLVQLLFGKLEIHILHIA